MKCTRPCMDFQSVGAPAANAVFGIWHAAATPCTGQPLPLTRIRALHLSTLDLCPRCSPVPACLLAEKLPHLGGHRGPATPPPCLLEPDCIPYVNPPCLRGTWEGVCVCMRMCVHVSQEITCLWCPSCLTQPRTYLAVVNAEQMNEGISDPRDKISCLLHTLDVHMLWRELSSTPGSSSPFLPCPPRDTVSRPLIRVDIHTT